MSVTVPILSGGTLSLFLLVLLRMTGLFVFNPVLGREEIPVMLRAGLGLLCALVVLPTIGAQADVNSVPQLVVEGLGELFVGAGLGVLLGLVIYVVQLAGELIDMQMGLTMAQMYDAHSNVNMPLFGNFFNFIVLIVFFAGNAHLALISFMSDSFKLIPPGTVQLRAGALQFAAQLGRDYFDFGFRMALPVLAVEVVCQIAMGLLMRAVPTISVFSIGMHLTALVGLVLLMLTAGQLTDMCGKLVTFGMEKAAEWVKLLSG